MLIDYLLPFQIEISEAVARNRVTSVAGPRQNGKTLAATVAAAQMTGSVMNLSRSPAHHASNAAHYLQDHVDNPRGYAANGKERVTYDGGVMHFRGYTCRSLDEFRVDTLILDDAHDVTVKDKLLADIEAMGPRRIIVVSVAPDYGLAKHYWSVSDKTFRWCSEDPEAANPLYGTLIEPEWIENERRIMTEEAFRRERLGFGRDE